MPLEFWVEAAHARLAIVELPVPLIYLDEKRSFGGSLDDAQRRGRHRGFVGTPLDFTAAIASTARSAARPSQPRGERCPTGAWDMRKFLLDTTKAGHACRS